MTAGELLTTNEAAKLAACSRQWLRLHADAGRVPVVVTRYGRLFDREAVEAYRRRREERRQLAKVS